MIDPTRDNGSSAFKISAKRGKDSNWAPIPNKYIFTELKSQVGNDSDQYDLLSLTLQGVIKRDMENPQGKFPAEFNTYQPIEKGDFIFCLFDVEETPRAVGLSPFDGMITGAYTAMRLNRDSNAKFLLYYYLNLDKDKRLRYLYKGLRNTIPKDSFFSLKTVLPPLPTQTRIANFLDEKTALIDKAIAQKQRLIELLEERRQILIHQAVTRGLDPNVELRDSGVDWIGMVPKHWEVRPLKWFSQFVNGISKGGEYFQSGSPFVTYGDVYNNPVLPKGSGVAMSNELEQELYSIKRGDVFFTRTSEVASEIGISSVALIDLPSTIFSGFIIRCRVELSIMAPEYSVHYFRSGLHQSFLSSEMTIVTRASLGQGLLGSTPIILPPLKEQARISRYCSQIDRRVHKSISTLNNSIEKLQEYKSTLINAAVSGQIEL